MKKILLLLVMIVVSMISCTEKQNQKEEKKEIVSNWKYEIDACTRISTDTINDELYKKGFVFNEDSSKSFVIIKYKDEKNNTYHIYNEKYDDFDYNTHEFESNLEFIFDDTISINSSFSYIMKDQKVYNSFTNDLKNHKKLKILYKNIIFPKTILYFDISGFNEDSLKLR